MQQRYGVLIVDDSSFMRKCISDIIEKDPYLFVIGIARNGQDAVEKIQRLKPDIVTMDVEMPEMDGIEALKVIMRSCPVPVVMLSNHTEEVAKTTLQALELGAVDFFLKNALMGAKADQQLVEIFLSCLKNIVEGVKPPLHHPIKTSPIKAPIIITPPKDIPPIVASMVKKHKADILIIGCSTGGPSALHLLLPCFPKDTNVPIVVIQHMPVGFTKPLADRLNTTCNLHVKEAEDGQVLKAGTIYIAPAGSQTQMTRESNECVTLRVGASSPIETLFRPSVNVTLLSAAQVYKNRLTAIIMTGMGNDGLMGCEEVKKQKGRVIVEAKESCVVYGMPRVVFEAGLADVQVPLTQIFQQAMQSL
ncbi:MAG: chemotaxis response regulator protein-glutamate methylesterase [Gorillibacterium sp.]|nr:chemotaxis response regulator protein-glutamate methylesterase [Gorillibacterium sp.]